jgi:hypothetical protein
MVKNGSAPCGRPWRRSKRRSCCWRAACPGRRSRWSRRPGETTAPRSAPWKTTTFAARTRIEGLFREMVALAERLQERERAYEAELEDEGGGKVLAVPNYS